MTRLAQGFPWKLLGGVCVLFVLSLLAPSLWRGWNTDWLPELSFSHWEAEQPLPSLRGRLPSSEVAEVEEVAPRAAIHIASHDVLPAPAVAPASDEPIPQFAEVEAAPSIAAAPAPELVAEPAELRSEARPAPDSLADYQVPSQVAPTGPVVAERIDLDPSVTETPNLPPHRPGIDDISDSADPAPQPLSLPEDHPLPPTPEPPHAQPPAVAGQWAYPTGLVEQLQALAQAEPAAADWTRRVIATIDMLAQVPTLADPSAAVLLGHLKQQADEGRTLALQFEDEDRRSGILRAGYAIVRRLSIWEPVHQLAMRGDVGERRIPTPMEWKKTMADVYGRLNSTAQAAAVWREYLLLEKARSHFGYSGVPAAQQRQLAREILYRMQSPSLSYVQANFLESAPFDRFAEMLRLWADEPSQLTELLAAIEAYEHLEHSAQSIALARMYDDLRWSNDPAVQELAETVNAYYRNANVRVAVSAELVNRLLPKQAYTQEPVRDMIQGAYVEGSSATFTRVRLVLLPDEQSWKLGLDARGSVTSTTASSKGPATFYQDGLSHYHARKLLTVDRRGVRMYSAQAQADANTQMTDFETDFDGIPFLGGLARSIARKQYDETSPLAKQEVEGKIVDRASNQLDREVSLKLQEGQRNFQVKLLDPLRELKVEPTAVSMQTTLERLIARYRLAGRDQVAAHTPRPQAPGDSLLSVQIHESAMNNVMEHLELQGRRVELRELYKEITARFSQGKALTPPDDLPEDVYVTFADEDPVRVDCQDGRVMLTIRLKELSQGDRHQWNDFMIRAYYAPDSDQLDANLVRDGAIELGGKRLRFGDQVALRGIFSRVLSRNRKLELVNKQIAQSPELRDQQVTQFVIHDGWIGVALGPKLPDRTTTLTPVPAAARKSR